MKNTTTAKQLKETLLSEMLYRLSYSVACDEFNFMDIFGIRRNGFSVEFEIKVAKSDFVAELEAITMPQPDKYSKRWTKWEKHAHYLKKDIKKTPSIYDSLPEWQALIPHYFIPNEFNFYVPEHLAGFALEKLQGLPYGLMKYGEVIVSHSDGSSHSYHSNYEVVKKPQKLHMEKNGYLFEALAHALSVRNRLIS